MIFYEIYNILHDFTIICSVILLSLFYRTVHINFDICLARTEIFSIHFEPKKCKNHVQKLQRQKNGALGRNIRSTVFWVFCRHSRLCFIVFRVFTKLHIFRQEPERFCHFCAKSVSGFYGSLISRVQMMKSRRWFLWCFVKIQKRNLAFSLKKHVFSMQIDWVLIWDFISETDPFCEIWGKILDRKPKQVSEKQWKRVTF